MKPIEIHEEAMENSFLAKQARIKGDEDSALIFYEKAASLESKAADFYFDKPDLEPTRSIIIRSAAFLNLKAGLAENAEKYIFHGLINTKDIVIKSQLYDALEVCLSLKSFNSKEISGNVEYIYKLRQRSISYIIEPESPEYSTVVTLEMISNFADNYMKSIRAYSKSKYKTFYSKKFTDPEKEESAAKDFQKIIKPVLTNAGFGSFKFSLATDYLVRIGEEKDFTKLKSSILLNYHNEIFIKDLTDDNIKQYRKNYTDEEIEEIFRPVINMKTNKSSYKIGYYDKETFKRKYLNRVKNEQKIKLIPVKKITSDEIGVLENVIAQKRDSGDSKLRSVIMRQELTSYSFVYPTNIIEPKGIGNVILNEQINIGVDFNSNTGFTLSFDDLGIDATSNLFDDALNLFYVKFIDLVKKLGATLNAHTAQQSKYWSILKRLISNPEAI